MKAPGYIDKHKITPLVETLSKPSFAPTYKIGYGRKKHLRSEYMNLYKQWYNAHNVYFYLLEVHAYTSFNLPIKIIHSDIHWLYQLKGHNALPCQDLYLKDQQHATLSLHKGEYNLHFEQGHHILAGFVAARAWMQRHTPNESHYLHKHLEFLDTPEVDHPSLFDTQEVTLTALKNLLLLTQVSHLPSIELDGILGAYAGTIMQEHIRMYELLADDPELNLIQTVHDYIAKLAMQEGDMPRIEEIAAHFGVTQKQLRKTHFETYGENPKNYLMRKRIDYAYHLLKDLEYSPTVTANKLGFSHLGHFSRMFKKQYGISPSQVMKSKW